MKSKQTGLVFCITACLLLSGCAPQTVNPLARNEATAVPGLAMNLHEASANDQNVNQVSVTLYFRYLDEPMLAGENRVLDVRRDESLEFAIVQALVNGPSAGHSELHALLPVDSGLESVASRGDILFVTLDEGFLNDGIPSDWKNDELWAQEAPLRRALTAQSIAASLTESFSYTGVQILVHKSGELQNSLRLDNSYFLNGSAGLSEPIARDETMLLTPQHTAEILLTLWQEHDAERLARYITEADKPTIDELTDMLQNAPNNKSFSVSGGTVSADGQSATLVAQLQLLKEGQSITLANVPLLLTRENDVWKITYDKLKTLLAH